MLLLAVEARGLRLGFRDWLAGLHWWFRGVCCGSCFTTRFVVCGLFDGGCDSCLLAAFVVLCFTSGIHAFISGLCLCAQNRLKEQSSEMKKELDGEIEVPCLSFCLGLDRVFADFRAWVGT